MARPTTTELRLAEALREMIGAFQGTNCIEDPKRCTGGRHASECYANPNTGRLGKFNRFLGRLEKRWVVKIV